jgi:hypothetical protein
MIDQIFSGAVTRGKAQKEGRMSYPEFVWFLIAEEDKRHPTRWVVRVPLIAVPLVIHFASKRAFSFQDGESRLEIRLNKETLFSIKIHEI